MKKIYSFFLITAFLIGCESSILDDPSTTINFAIPQRSYVKVTIENSYNTIVAVLMDGELNSGTHSLSYDPGNLAEGIYFYSIEARGIEDGSYYQNTRYMLLIK